MVLQRYAALAVLPIALAATAALAETEPSCDEMLKLMSTFSASSEEYAAMKESYIEAGCTAEPTTTNACAEADRKNAAVKASCTGTIKIVQDGGCTWYKCEAAGGSATACSPEESMQKYWELCKEKGGTPARATDARGCAYVRCPEVTGTSSCPATTQLEEKARACAASGGKPEKVQENGCWYVKCGGSSASTSTGAKDECGRLREGMAKADQSTEEYAKMKRLWLEKCEKPVPATAGDVQCWKNGCTVKCADGTAFNACMCAGIPASMPGMEGPVGPSTLRDGTGKTTDSAGGVSCSTQKVRNCVITRCTDGTIKRECRKADSANATKSRPSKRSMQSGAM